MNPYGAEFQIPDRIIIHSMGEYILDEKTNKTYKAKDFLLKLGLSAHVLIYPDGEEERLRRDDQGAYHAKGFNTNSLSIEFLVPGVHTYGTFLKTIAKPYLTESAFQVGLDRCRKWESAWHIGGRIDRHSDVDPKRKKDPGKGFPWERFVEEL